MKWDTPIGRRSAAEYLGTSPWRYRGAPVALLIDAIALERSGSSAITGKIIDLTLVGDWSCNGAQHLDCAATLLWLSAPLAAKWFHCGVPIIVGRSLPRFVSIAHAMIVLPILWLCATWLVWSLKMTVEGSWSSEGRILSRRTTTTTWHSAMLLGLLEDSHCSH